MKRIALFFAFLTGFLLSVLSLSAADQLTLVWPTPSTAFAEGQKPAMWVQPTESGTVESALFGCTRNGGNRFHEGIDIRPVLKLKKGEATDPIYAIMPGKVVYFNKIAGNSGYGRYVVLEHENTTPHVYSLYAHLARVDASLQVGQLVKEGTVLGVMGRSALYHIPQSRSHLHLEVGLRLTDHFEDWYLRQNYEEENFHSVYNGMNLTGFDPLDFFESYRRGEVRSALDYIRRLPVAYVLRISYSQVPDYVRRYPELLVGVIPERDLAGWDVAFTWFGLAKRWQPLTREQAPDLGPEGSIRMLSWSPEQMEGHYGKKTILKGKNGPKLGPVGIQILQLLFGFK
ncbi:MAG: M23 family metallopeptidase [Opitutales bacterium]|nr:M23 family metallopeptidase [Opitutales bacterium]